MESLQFPHPRQPGRTDHRGRRGPAVDNICGWSTRPMSRAETAGRHDDDAFPEAVDQLEAYFAGEPNRLRSGLDLVGTEFHRRVWAALLDDPLRRDAVVRRDRQSDRDARRLPRGRPGQRPQSDRHHRAVPSGDRRRRSLTGYGGGLDRKRALLELEKSRAFPIPTLFD